MERDMYENSIAGRMFLHFLLHNPVKAPQMASYGRYVVTGNSIGRFQENSGNGKSFCLGLTCAFFQPFIYHVNATVKVR